MVAHIGRGQRRAGAGTMAQAKVGKQGGSDAHHAEKSRAKKRVAGM
jgi:hypothetical protein